MDFTQYKSEGTSLLCIALKALDPVESDRSEEEPGEATGAVWIFLYGPKKSHVRMACVSRTHFFIFGSAFRYTRSIFTDFFHRDPRDPSGRYDYLT